MNIFLIIYFTIAFIFYLTRINHDFRVICTRWEKTRIDKLRLCILHGLRELIAASTWPIVFVLWLFGVLN